MVAVPATSTRDRLLASAIDVFVEQGYESARLQDIARGAGLTTGAIYANFRGKSDLLFDAIGARAATEMDALVSETRGRDVRELLGLLGDRIVRSREQAPPPLQIDAIAAARRDEELAGALRHRLATREAVLVELVERAKQDGTIDPALDTETCARFCLTLAMGALVTRTLHMSPPSGDQWHELISRLIDALAPEETE